MLAARVLGRRASLRRCIVSRAAPAATTPWSEPPKPPVGTLVKVIDAVRFTALKAAPVAATFLASQANVTFASSPEALEGLSNAAMTGLAIGAAVVGGGAALALTDEAAPDVASPLGEQAFDLGSTATALAPGGLHEENSLGLPYFVTRGSQESLKNKLNRFYGKTDEFTHDPQLVANVEACYDDCAELLGYLTFNPVISVAKNIWNITDPANNKQGAGCRSSALLGLRTSHHGARGAANEAGLYEEAATVDRLIMAIKARGGFTEYQQSVEFLLLACSMYMVHGSGDAHAKIMSAVPLNARCQYAFFNAKVRNNQLMSDKGEIVQFLDERGRAISDVVQREFQRRTAGGKKVKFLAFAQTGAMESPPGHADFDKRCVPRVNATVAEADGETLRLSGRNTGRFANHAIQAWYLLTLTLHLGLGLPTDADGLERMRWWWGNNFHFDLRGHLFGKKTSADDASSSSSSSSNSGSSSSSSNSDSSSSSGEESSDDEDEDERYAVWMGCSICYIFLTDALYDALSQKLLGPNYSLDLNDVAVAELIVQAMNDDDCKKVGDLEFLERFLEDKGRFHCPKTWA